MSKSRDRHSGVMNAIKEAAANANTQSRTTLAGMVPSIAGARIANESAQEVIQDLRSKLAKYESGDDASFSESIKSIDPKTVTHGPFRDRVEEAFHDNAFVELREQIRSTNGNVVPVLLRPLDSDQYLYEVVWGHRRHRACLDLGLNVRSFIAPLSDLEVVTAMEAENRNRKDLSIYEEALKYRRLLEQKMFKNQEELGIKFERSQSHISRHLSIFEIPEVVLSSLSDRRSISFRNVANMKGMIAKLDSDLIKKTFKPLSKKLSPVEVVGRLKLMAPDLAENNKGKTRQPGFAIDGNQSVFTFPRLLTSDERVKIESILSEFMHSA